MKIVVIVFLAILVVLVAALARHFWTVEGFADESKVCGGAYYMEIPGFLTGAECDDLMRASNKLFPSEVGGSKNSVLDTSIRKSMQMWYSPGSHCVTDKIRRKTQALIESTRCLPGKLSYEDVQVVRYDKRGKYDPHHDGDECDKECPRDQRLATVLVYLNDDFDGGHTRFPLLNVSVAPEKGKALFFWVADAETRDLFEKTLHGGDPVTKGRKWIANQWVRSS
jgi:prolyl 4-hydroxylase